MSVFTFSPMRSSLNSVSTRQQSTHQSRPTLPAFSGLHSISSLPSCLRSGEDASSSLMHGPQNGSTTTMMRHGRKVPRLGRPADQRKALLRSLTTECFRHGEIRTTKVKAKAIRKYCDKVVQLAKRSAMVAEPGNWHLKRQVHSFIYDKEVVDNLFKSTRDMYAATEGAERGFFNRNSGYCSVKVDEDQPVRRGDGTVMAKITFLDL